jgi:acetamidase/formamidase
VLVTRNCPDFELHRQNLLEQLHAERRSFLKSAFATMGGVAALAAGGSLVPPAGAQTAAARRGKPNHHYLAATAETVHWGYFSKLLKPQVEIDSGDYVTIETLTHHANDDADRMVKGDPGAESVYLWTREKNGVNRRGAGPLDGKLLGRGPGEGFGVHFCTGPVYVRGAEPGDILEVRIIDVKPRPCANPQYLGKTFGSNAAAWWGFHYKELITEPKPREVITIYEIDATGQRNWAKAVYNFRWTSQIDPIRCRRQDHRLPGRSGRPQHRPGEPRDSEERADSDPPAFRRDRSGAEGSRRGRLHSAWLFRWQHRQLAHRQGGDHVLSGRSAGRAVVRRRSARLAGRFRAVRHRDRVLLTGTFQLIPHKRATIAGTSLAELDHPLLETQEEWLVHGFSYANYLAELGEKAQQQIYEKSSVDLALKDAFRKMRRFLMTTKGLTEDEAVSLMSIAERK